MSDFRTATDATGWSIAETARRLSCNRRTAERWYSGANLNCPPEVLDYLRAVTRAIAAVPLPVWGAREPENG